MNHFSDPTELLISIIGGLATLVLTWLLRKLWRFTQSRWEWWVRREVKRLYLHDPFETLASVLRLLASYLCLVPLITLSSVAAVKGSILSLAIAISNALSKHDLIEQQKLTSSMDDTSFIIGVIQLILTYLLFEKASDLSPARRRIAFSFYLERLNRMEETKNEPITTVTAEGLQKGRDRIFPPEHQRPPLF